MAFSPPDVGCLVSKSLQKGGCRHPRTPLAMPLIHWLPQWVFGSTYPMDGDLSEGLQFLTIEQLAAVR